MQNYQNQYYQQPQPTVGPLPHPQCSGAQFSVNTTPTAASRAPSVQPPYNTVHSSNSQGKILNIKDPKTGQSIDLLNMNARKAVVSEDESVAPNSAMPITIRDPPAKSDDAQCSHEAIDDAQCIHDSEEQLAPSHQTASFIVASDEDVSSHETNDDNEQNDISSAVVDAEIRFFNESASESESLSEEKEGPESEAAIDDTLINLPQKLEKVGSLSTGNIQKYSRDQLMSIRSATDFSQMPPTPASAVTNVSSNVIKTYQRPGRRPQIRRVLTFNTDVVLDEVDNAYRPTHLSQNEKKEDTKMTLTFLLNHLTAATVQDCLDDIKKLNLKKEEDIDTLASTIVAKVCL